MSTTEAASPSQPSLGQRLRQAREAKNLTLAQISEQTRIPVPRLEDLENDVYANFGGITYVRSFLRTYASLVDLDAEGVLPEKESPAPAPEPGQTGGQVHRPGPAYLTPSLSSWVVSTSRTRLELSSGPPKHGRSRLAPWLLILVGLVVLGTVVTLSRVFSSSRTVPALSDPVPAGAPPPPVEMSPSPEAAPIGPEIRPAVVPGQPAAPPTQ